MVRNIFDCRTGGVCGVLDPPLCRLHDSRTYMESRLLHCYMVILVHFVSLLQVAGSIGGGKVKVAKITDAKKAKLL